MVGLLDDVQSKKPHFRCKGGVWSCTTYWVVGGVAAFRIGMGYGWRQAWDDWMKQEFA